MNAPDAAASQDTFPREGHGRLQDPAHRLPSHVTGYAVLKAQRTGSIPRLIAAPPDSDRSRPVIKECDASDERQDSGNISTPPGRLQTVTVVAGAPAPQCSNALVSPLTGVGNS